MEISISENDSENNDLSEAEHDYFPLNYNKKMLNIKKNIYILIVSSKYIPQLKSSCLYNDNEVFIIK